jgi:hypothetical protein
MSTSKQNCRARYGVPYDIRRVCVQSIQMSFRVLRG